MPNATVGDVLANRAQWACACGDAVAFLDALPDDSVDLLFTSPPYENARTYGLADELPAGQAWVDWMVRVVRAAAPKVKGLIAVNCEGRTRNYAYSGTPFLLFADLHRAGFNLRKPCVYERDGIPGSGGPDWFKNRWEPIICVTRPGRLPWSDNTACGHAPKMPPGGAMSYRNEKGERVSGRTKEELRAQGVKVGGRNSRREDGTRHYTAYVPPDLANPGNVIDCGTAAQLGHDVAHENEAPFPLMLAERFVLSFAPPGGVVCDPFGGSGTTCHAAVMHGRRFVGSDLRASQVELCERRMRTVTPDLFAGAL